MSKYISKLHKIEGAHFQNVGQRMQGLNKKVIKTVGVTDNTM